MDFRFMILGVSLILLEMVSDSVQLSCRKCKPGYYVSRQCTSSHDTVCKPCAPGSFTAHYHLNEHCTPCSTCSRGQYVLKSCTKLSNTVCESCPDSTFIVSDKIAKECSIHHQNDAEALPDTVDIVKVSDVILQDNEGKGLEASGESLDNIFEGSGVEDTSKETDIWPAIEGSGETPEEEPIDNVTYAILPEETDSTDADSGEATEGATVKIDESTTVKVGIVTIGTGIELPGSSADNETDKVVDGLADKASTTARPLNIGGVGVVLQGSAKDGGSVDVALPTTAPPQLGASKSEQSDDSTSIGVVVVVGLVVAVIFFVLGILASRYWSGRRDRTFNVLEAERRNGKTPVECSAVTYKDPENNGHNTVYDEIPANSPIVKSTKDPVYSKPIKRPAANPADRDGDWGGFSLSRNSSSGSLILQPSKTGERPNSSEIRYIDEDVEETETDRLLPANTNGTNSNGTNINGTSSNGTHRNGTNGSAPHTPTSSSDSDAPPQDTDETTPMLIRRGPNNTLEATS